MSAFGASGPTSTNYVERQNPQKLREAARRIARLIDDEALKLFRVEKDDSRVLELRRFLSALFGPTECVYFYLLLMEA